MQSVASCEAFLLERLQLFMPLVAAAPRALFTPPRRIDHCELISNSKTFAPRCSMRAISCSASFAFDARYRFAPAIRFRPLMKPIEGVP